MGSIDKKLLVKMAKALNKLDLTEDEVDVKSKPAELAEDFISAIEEIDDAGQIDEVTEKIVKFYDGLLDIVDEKKGKGKKDKGKKKDKKEKKEKAAPALDLEAIEEEIEDLDYDDLETWCEENHPDFDFDFDEDDDDLEDTIIPAIMKYLKKLVKKAAKSGGGKKDKKDKKDKKKGKGKKDKKDKKKKKDKKEKLPKGLRTGTLPAALYKAIADGGCSWSGLAEVCAEEKDKDAEKCLGMAMRTVSRKVSKAVPVTVTFNGDDDAAQFALVTEEEDDD